MDEKTNERNTWLFKKYKLKRAEDYIYTCTKCGCKCSIDGSYSDQGNNLMCRFCYESEVKRNGSRKYRKL